MKILITGVAGFIGNHLCQKLLQTDNEIVGLDNVNNYYDVNLKYDRLNIIGVEKQNIEYNKVIKSKKHDNLFFLQLNLEDNENLIKLFNEFKFDVVCNLAAQAGVRYSLTNPEAYINSNIVGFANVIECCKLFEIKHLVYASSSSVYGANTKLPFSVNDKTETPLSLYAASKKCNELIAYTYSSLYKFKTTGLRFFTVYGPWGRPDMALFMFTKSIIENNPIQVFNNGNMERDFTYIDDIVEAIYRIIITDQTNRESYKIYNIGNSKPVKLLDFISEIEKKLNKQAIKELMPIQKGDVEKTFADVSALNEDYNFVPKTKISQGISNFIDWYQSYYTCEKE